MTEQLQLFSSDQLPAEFFSEEESRGVFTGARLFSAKPELYKAIIALSAEGLGAIRIGRVLRVSPNTVLAVRAREPSEIDIEKKRLSELSREAARMCVEGIVEMLSDPDQTKKMSLKDKGIVFGILTEKSELLSGSPTARVQSVGVPTGIEVVEYLHWLRAQMGLGEERKGAKEVDAEIVAEVGTGRIVGAADDMGREEIVNPGATQRPDTRDQTPDTRVRLPEDKQGQTPHADSQVSELQRNTDSTQSAGQNITKSNLHNQHTDNDLCNLRQ